MQGQVILSFFVTIQSHAKLLSVNACIQTEKQFYMAKQLHSLIARIRASTAAQATATAAKIAKQIGNAQLQTEISIPSNRTAIGVLPLLVPASSIFKPVHQIPVFTVIRLQRRCTLGML